MSDPPKELPKDISLITDNLDKIPRGPYRGAAWNPLPDPWYRDFIEQRLLEEGDEATVRAHLSQSSAQMIEKVMKYGAINLGGVCWATKCPAVNDPGVCALVPVMFRDGPMLVCSGPTVQKTSGGILFSEKTTYKRLHPKNWCPYAFVRFSDDPDLEDFKEMLETVYPVLKRHEDYDVINFKEKYKDKPTIWDD